MPAVTIQVRRDTAANWTSANPTLAQGEWAYETDTNKIKIGNGSTAWASLPYGTVLNARAGTTTVPPLQLVSGTNLTSAAAGAIEYDGSVFYADVATSTRGVLPAEQIMYLGTAYTLTSATGVQKLFNGSTNGTVTLPVGDFQFECYATLSTLATTGTFGFAFGGTATYTQSWFAHGVRVAAGTNSTFFTSFNTAANVAITPTSATTTAYMYIRGTLNITVAGTIIPQFSQTVASAAVVGVGSYFKIAPLSGTSGTTNLAIGNWS